MTKLVLPMPDRQLRLLEDWEIPVETEYDQYIGTTVPAGSIIRVTLALGGWPKKVRVHFDHLPGRDLPKEGRLREPTMSYVSRNVATELLQGLNVEFIA